MLDGKAQLLLSSIVRDDKGCTIKASVDNGGWQLRIRDRIAYSHHYDWDKPMNQYPLPDWLEVEIPDNVKGDYNTVMLWAEESYSK